MGFLITASQGEEEGREREIVKVLLAEGEPAERVARVTGLDLAVVEHLDKIGRRQDE